MPDAAQPRLKARGLWRVGLALALVLAGATLLAVVVYQGDQPMKPNRVMPARAAFTLEIPAGCQMTEDPPGPDFQVFRITCGGVEYAGVYTGNAPDRGIPRSRVTATDFTWPSQVQAWSHVVPGDQEKADRISASVAVRAMN